MSSVSSGGDPKDFYTRFLSDHDSKKDKGKAPASGVDSMMEGLRPENRNNPLLEANTPSLGGAGDHQPVDTKKMLQSVISGLRGWKVSTSMAFQNLLTDAVDLAYFGGGNEAAEILKGLYEDMDSLPAWFGARKRKEALVAATLEVMQSDGPSVDQMEFLMGMVVQLGKPEDCSAAREYLGAAAERENVALAEVAAEEAAPVRPEDIPEAMAILAERPIETRGDVKLQEMEWRRFETHYRTDPDFRFTATIGDSTYHLNGLSDDDGDPVATGVFGRVFVGTRERTVELQDGRLAVVTEEVALKVAAAAPDKPEELEREINALAEMANANNVVGLKQAGIVGGLAFIAMENITGGTVDDVFESSTSSGYREKLGWVLDLAKGISECSEKGIVHRDLKPSNMMFRERDDGTRELVVVDLGLCTLATAESRESFGTPLYFSPEQTFKEPATEKSDVYAFGLNMFEFLAGVGYFEFPGEVIQSMAQLEDTQRTSLVVDAHRVPDQAFGGNSAVAALARELMADCLKRQPEERPSIGGVMERLAAIIEQADAPA